MNSEFNLVKRFLAETPPFWKLLQLIGLVVVLICLLVANTLPVSAGTKQVVEAIAGTLTLVAGFAKKDAEILKPGETANPLAVLSLLPDLMSQFTELKAVVQQKQTVTVPDVATTVQEIQTVIQPAAAPAATDPVKNTDAPGATVKPLF
jgi:hypothetical protein